jgi:hypothetical protein
MSSAWQGCLRTIIPSLQLMPQPPAYMPHYFLPDCLLAVFRCTHPPSAPLTSHPPSRGGYASLFTHKNKCQNSPMPHYFLPDCLLIVYRCTHPPPPPPRHSLGKGGYASFPHTSVSLTVPSVYPRRSSSTCRASRAIPYASASATGPAISRLRVSDCLLIQYTAQHIMGGHEQSVSQPAQRE